MSPKPSKRLSTIPPTPLLKARQRLGKYRIRRRIGAGAFATVYEAYDTIEGIRVALKVPNRELLDERYRLETDSQGGPAHRAPAPREHPVAAQRDDD